MTGCSHPEAYIHNSSLVYCKRFIFNELDSYLMNWIPFFHTESSCVEEMPCVFAETRCSGMEARPSCIQ